MLIIILIIFFQPQNVYILLRLNYFFENSFYELFAEFTIETIHVQLILSFDMQ